MKKFKGIVLAGGVIAALTAGGLTSAARAGDATGVWLRSDGKTKVRFSPCGSGLCGVIVWLKNQDSPAHVGQRVFNDMAPAGDNQWRGTAFNPEDGKTYTGKMSLSGASLTTAGCALGGLICKSYSWRRAN
ncbi:MAG TPA: DUF2147 domain-containing protein [Rhodoblastus sp.]|nr:DUF2147 domain-containing protein [Rhodoblastus sp.]